MNFELPPVGGAHQTPPAPRTTGKSGSTFSLPAATVPASPPPDVLEQMYDAAQVADKLRAQERELHFHPTDAGQVIVQVRDLNGNVIRTIAPSEALEVAAGKPLTQ